MKQIILLFVTFFTINSFAQLTLNDVTLPAKVKGHDKELVLNGGAIRKKAMFKVYVLGLYIPQKTKDAKAILNSNDNIVARLVITSSVVNSKNMTEAILEGFEKSTNKNMGPLQAKIDAFIAAFKDEIKTGDVFDLSYSAADGTKALKNGKLVTTVTGDDFKKALFGIWLGDNPIDTKVKSGILGIE